MKKDIKRVIEALEQQGFTCSTNRRGHTHVTKNGAHVTWIAGSPGEYRGWQNMLSALRRSGFEWPH